MGLSGGLKLALTGADRDDRRVRCVRVTVATVEGHDERTLITDSRGRLRYHLTAGRYRLQFPDGGETRFAVDDGRWTSIRLRLP
jgi:hypothetical protein